MPTAPKQQEFAKTQLGKTQIAGYDDKLVMPDDKTLEQKGGDLAIYSGLLQDDQVASTFQQRRLAVTSTEWVVDPGGDSPADKAAAEFMREQIARIKWDDKTDKMLYSVFFGYGVAEIMWQRQGNRIGIGEVKVRDRGRFRFGDSGALYLRPELGSGGSVGNYKLMQSADDRERKFWTIRIGGDHDDQPYGRGLAQALYWPVFFKRNDIKFWLVFLERFSGPTSIAKMPAGQYKDEELRKQTLQMLEAIATEGRIVIPEGTTVDFLESIYSGSADYRDMKSAMDAAIAKVVLSQTMTTDNGSSRSQSETHKAVRDEVVKADADLICDSWNMGPGKWLTELNFPGAAIPRVWRKTDPEEDLNTRAERDKNIAELGFEPTEEYIQETYGKGWVRKRPNELRVPGAGGDPVDDNPALFMELSELAATKNLNRADQQAISEAAQRFANRYGETVGPQIRQLLEFLDATDDLETFRDRLGEIAGQAPNPKAVENLERSGVVARLLGRLRGEID